MTHTQGQWDVAGQSDGGKYIAVKCGKRTVARVPFSSVPDDAPLDAYTDAADARLIAAAPELLSCLRAWVESVARYELVSSMVPVYDAAVQAISKAEGRG